VARRDPSILEDRAAHPSAAVRRERVVELIMLMTAAASERARAVESNRPVELDDETFAANLTDVLVGVLEAPLRGPLPAAVAVDAIGDPEAVNLR
jgi:hypothetical protein